MLPKCNQILIFLLLFVNIRLSLCSNKSVDEKLRRESLINATFKLDASDTVSPFETTIYTKRDTNGAATADFKTTSTNTQTLANTATLPIITARNEFEKSTTYVPAYFSQRTDRVDDSTPKIKAVYEEIPEEEQSNKPNTEPSLFTNAGTGPIYVTVAESHHEICDFCIYEGEGNFTSYGYPLDYRSGLNCSYRIQRVDTDVCELELIFHDFDVPISTDKSPTLKGSEHSECSEDYLEVYGRRFCGPEWKDKTEIVPFPETEKEVTFYFRSNEVGAGRGFWVEVRRKPGTCYGKKPVQVCEERFGDQEFYITSPRFPHEYPANSECTYYIRKHTDSICGLEFTFLHFDLESVNGCFYDHLEIDGQKYCGILQPNTVKVLPFIEDQKVLTFHSDKQGSKTGFQIRVKQITDCRFPSKLPPPPSCNICTTDRTGILVSYNYPDHYRNNLMCTYTIDKKDPNYCKVELFFDDFEVLPSLDCKEDYLLIRGKKFCGTTLHGSKEVVEFGSSNSINLIFKTNDIGNGKGFSMKYTQLKCGKNGDGQGIVHPKKEPTEEPMERHMCNYNFNEKSFIIRSENISNMYPNNIHCNYLIKKNSSAVCYLEFTFFKFDVEASPQCQFDYLEVNNVRLCGSLQKETTRTYIFEEPEKLIKFHSDASTNREGFAIQIDQLECQGDAIIRSSTTSTTTAVTNLPYFPSEPSTQSCDQTYVGHEFEITSPLYPNSYPLTMDCMFIIQKLNPNICRLEVTYYDFTIQSPDMSGYCKYDYLDFNGIRMCGDVQKGSVRSYYFPENNFNVRFHSDALYTANDKGFRIGVRQNECGNSVTGSDLPREIDKPKCDEIFTKTTFEIKSPNYPETYPTNINCQYTIVKKTNGIPVCQLEVHFSDVRIEDDIDCQSDYIDFEGTKFCGPQPQKLVKFFPFDRSEFTIKFRSDGTDRGDGKKTFFMQIRQRECPDGFSVSTSSSMPKPTPPTQEIEKGKTDQCSQTFSEKHFEIISPRYPGMYENNLDCFYIIKRNNPGICRVDLLFIDFDLEDGKDCERDFLSIDGMKMCGQFKSNTMRSFIFTGSEKILIFHSDPARIKGGFYIKGEQKECDSQEQAKDDFPPPIGAAPSICEICYAETAGIIKSYGYPNNYPNNLNCIYKITGFPDYCSVYIKFDEFNLQPPRNSICGDYVEIEGNRYCGSQLQGQKKIVPFQGSPKEVIMRFASNGNGNSRGFRGSYTQFPCTDMDTKQTTLSSHPLPGIVTTGTGPITVVQNGDKKTGPHMFTDNQRIPCDLVIFNKAFEIKSPGYPHTYPPNSDCLYSIRRVNPDICKIRLEILDFETDPTPDCKNDYLELQDQRLCGKLNKTTKEYAFPNYKFTLRFRCDALRSRKGFLIRGQQLECKPQGYIPAPPMQQYPEMASHYPTYPIDQRMLNVGYDPSSRFSHPMQYDPSLAPYASTGYAPQPPPFQNSFSESDGHGQRPGFYGFPRFNGDSAPLPPERPPVSLPPAAPSVVLNSYPSQNISNNPSLNPLNHPYNSGSQMYPLGYGPQSVSCNRIINDAFFDIKSPNYPFRYKEGTKCMYVIKKFKENVCQLDLMFITFEIGDATCHRDFLSIEGERLCGLIPKEKVKTFKFDAIEKYIFFKGEIGGGLGFHIRGRQVECVNPNINIDTPVLHPQPQQSVVNRAYPDQRSVPLPYCDQTFSETSFLISSPGYPNNYPNSLFCRFTIHRPTSSVCALDMKFRNFDVEDDPKCAKDYLEIDNGKVCGHLPPNHERRYYYFPEEQKKIFIFRSDAFISKSGFAIDVKQITDCSIHSWKPESPPPPVCDLCSSEVRGHFTSNNYPKNYVNYVRCTYRISPYNEHYCKVRLYIRDLDIEESQACDKDYLYIQNERICNTNYRPKELTAYFPQFGPKEIQFSFHTDSRNTRRGFYVEYMQELCTVPSLKPGSGHQYPSATTNGQTDESRNYEHHKGRSHASVSPQYPPNYVSKAHIEEIVETKVKVLDARSDPPSVVEHRNNDHVRPVTISVQKAGKRSGVYNSSQSSFIEAH